MGSRPLCYNDRIHEGAATSTPSRWKGIAASWAEPMGSATTVPSVRSLGDELQLEPGYPRANNCNQIASLKSVRALSSKNAFLAAGSIAMASSRATSSALYWYG